MNDWMRPRSGPDWKGLWDWQWKPLERLVPAPKAPFRKVRRKGGRPPVPARRCFDAILWVARTGGGWDSLPPSFPPKRTVLRRLAGWTADRRLDRLWRAYLYTLAKREREAWGVLLDGVRTRPRPFWHWTMAAIYRLEFGRIGGET